MPPCFIPIKMNVRYTKGFAAPTALEHCLPDQGAAADEYAFDLPRTCYRRRAVCARRSRRLAAIPRAQPRQRVHREGAAQILAKGWAAAGVESDRHRRG